ncbi:MAG: hypothetical protein E7A86_35580, partial [Bradyrhizobium sp.]|nr:hypothetical protein [Bradyrhizobium sp.]
PAAAPKTRNPMARMSSKVFVLFRSRRAASLDFVCASDEDIYRCLLEMKIASFFCKLLPKNGNV